MVIERFIESSRILYYGLIFSQIVHVTDDQGNVQEITYVQDDGTHDSLPTIVQVPRQEEDPSYEFYDNARGKISNSF